MGNLKTYSFTVSYNGAPFSGFARQPGQLTVQGELEHALQLLFRREVETVCAGRTDAGVHALGQVVSFEAEESELDGRSPSSIVRSMNALTHDNISVLEMVERREGFSARFDAVSREYRYFICTRETAPVFMDCFSWHLPHKLNVEAMREASQYLLGEHDFKSFCLAVSAVGKPTCRNVQEISFFEETIMDEPMLVIKVIGNAFLHSMVRTIVGTLVMVGHGKRSPEWVKEVLEALDRKAAGENAPAKGLVFWHVDY